MPSTTRLPTFCFGEHELDAAQYRLRRNGRVVRLERQPMELLLLLVERRGQLVSRNEIIDRLWGKDVFVDVETGVNTAIRKVRQALRDSPDTPVFIETVPARGYRFIADVTVAEPPAEAAATPGPEAAPVQDTPVGRPFARAAAPTSRLWRFVATGAVIAAAAGGFWLAVGVPRSPVTLAVLPFANLSGDPGREYMADGLAEETIASLGQADPEHVAVIGRTSVMAYKGTTKSVAEIGRELGAEYLVESSLRTEGGRFRVTSKLIRVADQVQIWSASFDREPTSLLGLQQELSAAIAAQIRLRLTPQRAEALSRRQTKNADAYDLYLRGINFAKQRTPATTRKAVEYLVQATATDPDYGLAWSGLALTYASSTLNGDAPPLAMWPLAREAAAHATRADPTRAEAQFSRAYVDWLLEWDWTAAEAALRRATALDASDPVSIWTLGHLLSQMGRHAEAAPFMRRTRELDPFNPMTHAMASQVAFQARDYAGALELARQSIAVDPEFWIGYMMQGQAHERLNQPEPALESLATAARLSPNSKAIATRGYLLARLGRTDEARVVIQTLEAASRDRYVPPYALALVHAGLGQAGEAFALLERAAAGRDPHVIFLTVDPKWDSLRTDARFAAILGKCGFKLP